MSDEHFLWVEKYRPKSIDECILPERYKKVFNDFLNAREIPNMLLSGGAGMGKTTVAKALCNQLKCDVMVINASENGNIDTLRTQIRQFASTKSLMGGLKVVILDEADYLNPNSTQPALRNFMEEFSRNCRFILTANFANRIIAPLHSRCTTIEFTYSKKESALLAGQFMSRCEQILKTENVNVDRHALAEVIKKYFPDFRKVLNELQRFGMGGNIESEDIASLSDTSVKQVIGHIKSREFNKMRKWVSEHSDSDPLMIMRSVVEHASELFVPRFIPNAIMIYNKYDYQNAFVTDREINLVAFFTELMVDGEFL